MDELVDPAFQIGWLKAQLKEAESNLLDAEAKLAEFRRAFGWEFDNLAEFGVWAAEEIEAATDNLRLPTATSQELAESIDTMRVARLFGDGAWVPRTIETAIVRGGDVVSITLTLPMVLEYEVKTMVTRVRE